MSVIRVSGHHGSGKTTVCNRLAEALGYGYVYVGGIFRKMAQDLGKSLEQFYAELANNPEHEKEVDRSVAELLAQKDKQIIEGRMAPFWPTPFEKVNLLFTIDPVEGARRQLKRPENARRDLSQVAFLSGQRLVIERARYRALYGIDDFLDAKHFDEVIDTTNLDQDGVFEETLRRLASYGILPKGCSRR